MPEYSLRVSGGRVYQDGGFVPADVLIDGESIAGIVRPGTPAEAAETIDASDRFVLPGMIDTHVHTRDPGYTHKEDFHTASMAAAAGGVTTIVDMPNVEPPTDTAELFEAKRQDAAKKSVVDWGHWCAATRLEEIPRLAEAGATGYKIFQVSGAYPHDPRLAINDDGPMLRAFREIATTGLPCVVHPFNQSLFDELAAEAFASGKPPDWRTFSEVYTNDAVWSTAVHSLLSLEELSGVRLHLAHTHAARSLRLVRGAKERGLRVTAEVDPKYYMLTLGDLERLHGLACPGGYVHADAERLAEIYRSLNDGTIDNIGTDHAPHTREEIAAQEDDAWRAAAGSPQLDWAYTLLLDDYVAKRYSAARLVALATEGAAKMLGVWPQKGQLAPGSDADLVLAELNCEQVISDQDVLSKCGWTPYDGKRVRARIDVTMLRGRVIARERKVIAEPGNGKYIAGRAQ